MGEIAAQHRPSCRAMWAMSPVNMGDSENLCARRAHRPCATTPSGCADLHLYSSQMPHFPRIRQNTLFMHIGKAKKHGCNP